MTLSNFIEILFSCWADESTALISYFWVPSLKGTWILKVPSAASGTSSPPIVNFAVDSSGKQEKSISMKFDRVTPIDDTNYKDKAQKEWF